VKITSTLRPLWLRDDDDDDDDDDDYDADDDPMMSYNIIITQSLLFRPKISPSSSCVHFRHPSALAASNYVETHRALH